MRSDRVLRLDLPTREALELLATADHPGGLSATPAHTSFFRDLYLDDADGTLEARGVTVRFRIRPDGGRQLAVDVRERPGVGGEVESRRAEAEVEAPEWEVAVRGGSEPARLLQAMTDPQRLGVKMEMETTRRGRELRDPGHRGVVIRATLDAVTLRRGEESGELREMELRFAARAAPVVQALVGRLEAELDARVVLASRVARARELLEELEGRRLERALAVARQVAVAAFREGEMALLDEEGELRVPAGRGWGEGAARAVLREHFGESQGRLRRLGTSAGLVAQPAVEVWLVEGVGGGGEGLRWVVPEALLARVGAPELRDPATLAALNFALRAGLPESAAPMWSALPRPRKEHPLHRVPRERARATGAKKGVDREKAPAPDELLNMELSELAFQARVLALARDAETPLLERVRFLSILGSNLDQFFMTRVAGFQHQLASGRRKRTLDGLTAAQQLSLIGVRVREILARTYGYLWGELVPELRSAHIALLSWEELDEGDREYLTQNYARPLGAVLNPLAADPSHPFPHIRNLRPALAAVLRVPETGTEHFAAIELPGDFPRMVPLPGGRRFVALEEVIRAALPELFPGLEIVSAHVFRVTRSANFSIDDETASDLLEAVQEKVLQRPLGPVVRLEVESSMPEPMRQLLLRELQFESEDEVSALREEDVYSVDRFVDLQGLSEIAELPIEELHYPPFPRTSPLDPARSVWSIIEGGDVLVRFPRDSFEETVERVLAEAADDERVAAIKITLYRTSRSSDVVNLLRRARRNGKEVLSLVELKASFDEQRNIEWARALEAAGIHVIYGPAHLKVHAKVMLIVRREAEGVRRYAYVGTGNLNAATAAGYTDLGLLTADPAITEEIQDVFNGLAGYSIRTDYERLLVAPFNMRERFLALIGREAEHARAGRGGHMRVKINGLTDPEIIAALYRASQAGVHIEMVVRGICCLRPGVRGLSENISVVSILGRFLEHSRIYRFANDGEPEYFIGSADWRPRNLSRRVEVVTPVREPSHHEVLDSILEADLESPTAWELRPDGEYIQRSNPSDE